MNTRFVGHNFIINSLYYFWTNFWYLLPFVSVFLLLTASLYVTHTSLWFIAFFILILFYFLLLSYYWVFNALVLEIFWKNELLNILLANSINKYHPFVFYSALIYTKVIYFEYTNYSKLIKFKSIGQNKYIVIFSILYVVAMLITLVLGGWWALQEGSWGGWWNWDPSETFGLVIFIYYTFVTHSNFTKFRYHSRFITICLWVNLILSLYILIQLNFDLVSHNFGTRVHQFTNTYYVFLWLLLMLFYRFYYYTFKNFTQLQIHLYYAKISFVWNLIIFFTSCVLLISFLELWINSTWILFTANNLNSEFNLSTLIYIQVFLVTVLYYNTTFFNSLLITFSLFFIWPLNFLFLTFLNLKKLFQFHKLILSWAFFSFLYINYYTSTWSLNIYHHLPTLFHIRETWNYFNLKLNISHIEINLIKNSFNYYCDVTWTFIHNASTFSSLLFSHLFTNDFYTQTLSSVSFEFFYNIQIIDSYTTPLPLIIVLYLLYLMSTFRYKLLIIF